MGNFDSADGRVRVIASATSWVEGEALRQLNQTADLPGMRRAVGLPDLHPGKGTPVGAAFLAEGVLYPHLVGNDIGCGMGLWQTDLPGRRLDADRCGRRLSVLDDGLDDGEVARWLEAAGLRPDVHDDRLGTIGLGNHFAEMQAVEAVQDEGRFAALGLERERLALLVHSGSRGFGEAVLRDHAARFGGRPVAADSAEGLAYLARHDRGVAWARLNRSVIRHRFLEGCRTEGKLVLDVCHNGVCPVAAGGCACWLHRKGAAPADQGPVVIPGSRGSFSYLVEPVGPQEGNLWSLAHGAGRKWSRDTAAAKVGRQVRDGKGGLDGLARTALGGRVVCEDKALLLEEAPPAYKDIDRVVGDLVEAGLVRVIAVYRPVLTFKTAGRRA